MTDFDQDPAAPFGGTAPIPALLHSVYEEGPFTTCAVCNDVLADGRVYEIQKVFHGSEVVFEMAICHECGEEVSSEFSEESIERLLAFFSERFRPSSEPDHCNFCGFPRALFESFTVVGICRESSILLPSVVMCGSCGEKVQENLSRKTRDTQDGFIRDHFPGVPADLDLSPSLGGLLG